MPDLWLCVAAGFGAYRGCPVFAGVQRPMTVYVDDMNRTAMGQFRRMKMCHMVADTEEELLEMVDRIGVQRKWRQGTPYYDDHFDIAQSKRTLAIAAGAVPISMRLLAFMVSNRKHAFANGVEKPTLGDPATAEEALRDRFRSLAASPAKD